MTSKEKELRNYIEEKLIDHYRNCSCDRYGQMRIVDVHQVFKERAKEVMEYVPGKNLIAIGTYAYAYGTYRGISPHGGILDKDLKAKCKSAFKLNPLRLNMNQW